MPSPPPINPNPQHPAAKLLARAHSPGTASALFIDKIVHKPLILRGTSPDPNSQDARAARRRHRLRLNEKKAKQRKSKHLSAKEKRQLGIYEIPKEDQRFDLFVPLHRLWKGYMREILGLDVPVVESAKVQGKKTKADKVVGDKEATANDSAPLSRRILSPAAAGPILASADYHGAFLEIVQARCVDRVGIRGIVVKDTKFTFEIVTEDNKLKVIPKEHTLFRFQIPYAKDEGDSDEATIRPTIEAYMFELHGSAMLNRAVERATKKFKPRKLG